jgi:uncharacterized protein YgbK (DUF1537 family)
MANDANASLLTTYWVDDVTGATDMMALLTQSCGPTAVFIELQLRGRVHLPNVHPGRFFR